MNIIHAFHLHISFIFIRISSAIFFNAFIIHFRYHFRHNSFTIFTVSVFHFLFDSIGMSAQQTQPRRADVAMRVTTRTSTNALSSTNIRRIRPPRCVTRCLSATPPTLRGYNRKCYASLPAQRSTVRYAASLPHTKYNTPRYAQRQRAQYVTDTGVQRRPCYWSVQQCSTRHATVRHARRHGGTGGAATVRVMLISSRSGCVVRTARQLNVLLMLRHGSVDTANARRLRQQKRRYAIHFDAFAFISFSTAFTGWWFLWLVSRWPLIEVAYIDCHEPAVTPDFSFTPYWPARHISLLLLRSRFLNMTLITGHETT